MAFPDLQAGSGIKRWVNSEEHCSPQLSFRVQREIYRRTVVLFESGSTLAMVARTGEVSFAINSGPTVIAARTQGAGSLDATLVSPPLDLTAKKLGLSIIVNIADLGIAYPQLVIETSGSLQPRAADHGEKFLEGLHRGNLLCG